MLQRFQPFLRFYGKIGGTNLKNLAEKMFQPFLRFYSKTQLALESKDLCEEFQPFLRFYTRFSASGKKAPRR